VNAIDIKFMDIVQDWLNEVEITFSKGPKALNWTDVMKVSLLFKVYNAE